MATGTVYKRGTIPVILVVAACGYFWFHSRVVKTIAVGYVAEPRITLWDTPAQVRQRVQELHFGERVEVVRQEGTASQLRTPAGTLGWLLDTRQLMDPTVWDQFAAMCAHARTMPVQARGHTRAISNVHIEAGRNARRVFQFPRGTPLLVLGRAVADIAQSNQPGEEKASSEAETGDQQKSQKEDWFFVLRDDHPAAERLAQSPATSNFAGAGGATVQPVSEQAQSGATPSTPMAGWVLARFIEFDLPDAVRDYVTSANLRVIAWFELNRVPNGSGGEAPQYLVAASRGGAGQSCDFTMLRVYTWSAARQQYETAYIENDLCGHLPLEVSTTPAGPQFQFQDDDENSAERAYIMRQTIVRRVVDRAVRRPR